MPQLAADVNSDGSVNIQTLVRVAGQLRKTGDNRMSTVTVSLTFRIWYWLQGHYVDRGWFLRDAENGHSEIAHLQTAHNRNLAVGYPPRGFATLLL